MAEPYLTDLRSILAQALGEDGEEVVCKHFFSGAAAPLFPQNAGQCSLYSVLIWRNSLG